MNTNDRDALITEYLPLVGPGVGRFVRKYPALEYLRDDMVSEAQLALVEFFHHHGKRSLRFDRIAAYLIRWACFQVIKTDESFAPLPRCCPRRRLRQPLTDKELAATDQQAAEADIQEWIDAHCRDYADWAVVTLTREGFSIPQIAKHLRLSYPTVKRRLKRFGELASK